jgi:hypothetical protein
MGDQTWFETVFADPDEVGQTEYLMIYEAVEGFRNDPEQVAGMLREFVDLATERLEHLERLGVGQSGAVAIEGVEASAISAGAFFCFRRSR